MTLIREAFSVRNCCPIRHQQQASLGLVFVSPSVTTNLAPTKTINPSKPAEMTSVSRSASEAWSPRHSRTFSMPDPDERAIVDGLDTRTPLDRTIDRIGMGASELQKKARL